MALAEAPAALDQATDYARDVADGRIIAGPYVRQAVARHLADLKEGHARGLVWDPDEAAFAIEFFSHLRLAEGQFEGKPFILEPWECFIVGSIFGWLLTDGTRRFRTAFLEIAKGNGKTPLADGVGLKGAVADGEHSAEVYTAGVTREQAAYLLTDMTKMVEASPALRARVAIGAHNLAVPATGSYIRPVSSEGRSLDQKRVHMALIDEIHEHRTPVVVNKMRAGTKGRRNALIFEITNSGYDRHSICWQHHEYSRKVLDGSIPNDSWFAYVCALDEGDDWTDESVWIKTNPNLGVSINLRYLREQVAEALGMPANENLVKRLNFCVWTESSARWLPVAAFDACQDPDAPGDRPWPMPAGREVWGGLDLASTTDLSAFFTLSPRPTCELHDELGKECFDIRCTFWLPADELEAREKRDGVPYRVWSDAGWIRLTPGNVTDYDRIRPDLAELLDGLVAHQVGYDRWNSSQIVIQLGQDGLDMLPVGQGFASLATPAKTLEGHITGRLIHHDGNPVLRWMVASVVAEQDPAGNLKPSRSASTNRIDGIAAWCDALFAWNGALASAEPEFRSVYEGRGLMFLRGQA